MMMKKLLFVVRNEIQRAWKTEKERLVKIIRTIRYQIALKTEDSFKDLVLFSMNSVGIIEVENIHQPFIYYYAEAAQNTQ